MGAEPRLAPGPLSSARLAPRASALVDRLAVGVDRVDRVGVRDVDRPAAGGLVLDPVADGLQRVGVRASDECIGAAVADEQVSPGVADQAVARSAPVEPVGVGRALEILDVLIDLVGLAGRPAVPAPR